MARPPLSVTIITLNEEKNIPDAIRSVQWADEIIVVDSGSTDKTQQIAREMGAKTFYNPWPGYGKQKNFAQSQATHDWILNLDADERVTRELAEEIVGALETVGNGKTNAKGFAVPRKTFYLGRWIKHGGWYPNFLIRLADRRFARWSEPSVHEKWMVDGEVAQLKNPLDHYAFSSIQDQILTNLTFSRLGSQDLKRGGQRASLFRLITKPVGKFFETYFLKGGFLDGLAGFIIAVNAAHSMFLKYAYLAESKIYVQNPNHR